MFPYTCYHPAKNFVTIDPPPTQIIGSTVFTTDASATAAISGVYSSLMSTEFGFANSGITLYTGLSSDELVNYSSNTAQMEFYNNSLTASNGIITNLWGEAYKNIYAVNSIIEGLSSSHSITPATKNHLKGEAHLLRAFLHFYLVNLYGPIPYITSTDYRLNASVVQMSRTEIFQHLISDLKEAQDLLTSDYLTSERVRPNKWAAAALLARVYLYMGDWTNAAMQATLVLNNSSQYVLVSDPAGVFLKTAEKLSGN